MSEDEGLQVQAVACPAIRGAYLTGDPEVIRNTEAVHPPSKCVHVKRADG